MSSFTYSTASNVPPSDSEGSVTSVLKAESRLSSSCSSAANQFTSLVVSRQHDGTLELCMHVNTGDNG